MRTLYVLYTTAAAGSLMELPSCAPVLRTSARSTDESWRFVTPESRFNQTCGNLGCLKSIRNTRKKWCVFQLPWEGLSFMALSCIGGLKVGEVIAETMAESCYWVGEAAGQLGLEGGFWPFSSRFRWKSHAFGSQAFEVLQSESQWSGAHLGAKNRDPVLTEALAPLTLTRQTVSWEAKIKKILEGPVVPQTPCVVYSNLRY